MRKNLGSVEEALEREHGIADALQRLGVAAAIGDLAGRHGGCLEVGVVCKAREAVRKAKLANIGKMIALAVDKPVEGPRS